MDPGRGVGRLHRLGTWLGVRAKGPSCLWQASWASNGSFAAVDRGLVAFRRRLGLSLTAGPRWTRVEVLGDSTGSAPGWGFVRRALAACGKPVGPPTGRLRPSIEV